MPLLAVLLAVAIGQLLPALPTEALDGKSVVVPVRGTGGATVYVVTFERAAQSQASEWSTELRKTLPAPTRVFQVAVLDDVPAFVRSFVVSGIRRSVPESIRGTFLVASERGGEWRSILGFLSGSEAYIFAATRDGHVLWRAHGKFSAASLTDLVGAVSQQH